MEPQKPSFKVSAKRCDECLFSSAKIVSDSRRDDVLATCEATDTHFVCHKFTIEGGENADTCCRGFYDRSPGATPAMRLAHYLDIVKFIDLPHG